MPELKWDEQGDRLYETGIDKGVLYVLNDDGEYTPGVAWNGLIGVDENPSGADATKLWADNTNYVTLYSAEEFGLTLKAYTYPEEFEQCDGSKQLTPGLVAGQQERVTFGLAYRTKIGNDEKGNSYGYKIHLVYGCKASPSSKSYNTINDSPEAIEFSWEVTTTPVKVNVTGFDTTSYLEIDSTKFADATAKAKLKALEDELWGKDGTEQTDITANLPMPEDVYDLLKAS